MEIVQNFEILCGEQRYCRYFSALSSDIGDAQRRPEAFKRVLPLQAVPVTAHYHAVAPWVQLRRQKHRRRCKRKTGVKYGGSIDVQR